MSRNLRSTITQTTCFSHIQRETAHLTEKSLVIFDIDDVLVTAKDNVLRGSKKEKWLDHYFNSLTPEESLEISSYVWTAYETEITDIQVAYFNEDLRARNIPSIALTKGWNGSMANRPSHCDDRIQTLKDIGIDFRYSFPNTPEIFLNGLENCGKIPSFKEGVIFSCMLSKAIVLDAFLKAVDFKPDEIIFIDDMLNNLEDIQTYCETHAVNYQGFHYVGVDARETQPLNEEIAHLQFQTALREKKWLNDAQAHQKLLHKPKSSQE